MNENQHRVVIVGAGFAGLRAAQALARAPVEITVVDRRNHHLFQPLLYQVATGGLSPADIAAPIRGLLGKQKNARVLLAEAVDVDAGERRLTLDNGALEYDTLVIATGSRHAYFGHPEWESFAPGLKTLDDATRIRHGVLMAFEAAERGATEEERRALLTFVVVGGGPTGVEMAGSLGELTRHTLRADFRRIDTARARIVLVEGIDRVLPSYDGRLSAKAQESLARLGVEVLLETFVTGVDEDGVMLKGRNGEERLATRNVIWGAGVASSPLGTKLVAATGAELDRAGRVIVTPQLTVPDHPEIFVAGDLAHYAHQTGEPLRGTADVAQAEGDYIGKLIRARLAGRDRPPFRFFDLGKMAVIGRSSAVAELRLARLSGFVAWLIWLFIHLMKLVDFQSRLTVFLQWGWNYFTRNRTARLIRKDQGESSLRPGLRPPTSLRRGPRRRPPSAATG